MFLIFIENYTIYSGIISHILGYCCSIYLVFLWETLKIRFLKINLFCKTRKKFKSLKLFYKLKRPLSLLALMFLFIILYFYLCLGFSQFITVIQVLLEWNTAYCWSTKWYKALDYLKEKPSFCLMLKNLISIETNIAGIKDKIITRLLLLLLTASGWQAAR